MITSVGTSATSPTSSTGHEEGVRVVFKMFRSNVQIYY